MINIEAAFEKFNPETGPGEFLEFDRISHKLHQRPDIHAFLLLSSLVPSQLDMVSSAEHDEIFLEVDPDDLAKVATEEQIRDLVRCGVRLDDDHLCMFV